MVESTPLETEEERLVGGYAGGLLVLIAAGTMVSVTGRLVLSPLLPRIIDSLAVTPSMAGVALTVAGLLAAFGRYPGGRLADQLSQKTVLVGALAVSTVGFAVVATATSFPHLLVGLAAVGVGLGPYGSTAVAQLSDLYVARRGQALGVHETFINLGGVAAGVLGAVALGFPSWRYALVPVVLLVGAMAVGLHRWHDGSYVVRPVRFEVGDTGRRLLDTAGVGGVLVACTSVGFAWQSVNVFLPTYLQVEKAFSPTLAANAFAAIFAIGIVANLGVGRLGDRFGRVEVSAVVAVTATVGLAVVVVGDSTVVVLAGVGLLAVGLTAFWPVIIAHLLGFLSRESVAGDYGAVSTVFLSLSSLGPAYVGVVAERASYGLAFAGVTGCLAVGSAVTLWLSMRR